MSLKSKINELLAKIEAIGMTNADKEIVNSKSFDKIADNLVKDLPSSKDLSKKLESLKSKRKNRKNKKQNNKDIFSELIGVVDKILDSNRSVSENDRFASKQRLKRHAIESADFTMNKSKEIIMNCVKDAFFSNGGICGTDIFFSGCTYDEVMLKPREFDLLNMLTISPNSDLGKIIYEPIKNTGREKINRKLYQTFENTSFQYDTLSNKTLFTIKFDYPTQQFKITGLTQGSGPGVCGNNVKVEEFFDDYYSSMEMPDIQHIIKNAMLMTLNSIKSSPVSTGGGNSEDSITLNFDKAINEVERMIKKIMSFCGNRTKKDDLKKQNATDLFDENEDDEEFYFNFDDVEGIDLDDEDARLRKVLIFQSCNNFEVPINDSIVEDFIFLSNKKNPNDLINSTINKAASDAFEQSDGSFDLPSFQLSLNIKFLLKIPVAMIQSLLSAKIFLPIVIVYKLFANTLQGAAHTQVDIKDLMRRLKNLFLCIIKEVLWTFLREFWKRIKADIKNFIKNVIASIIKSKYKKYYMVLMALIAFLKEAKETNLDNCAELFEAISKAIDAGINAAGNVKLKIPKPLLALSSRLPALNDKKTMLDIVSKLQSLGFDIGPINGERNEEITKMGALVSELINNLAKAPMSTTNALPITVATPLGPGIIPPFTLNSNGLFNT